MKKFSTAGYLFVFAAACAPLTLQAATPQPPSAAENRSNCAFLDNAPDKHVVARGDTLWGISGKFLQNPWCWPQVWGLNREQIRNPHWIYPGQIVYLDRASGRLRLGTPTGNAGSGNSATGGLAEVKLSPQVRMEGVGREAISAIPSGAIEPFLSQPLIVEENELKDAPRIVAVQEGRVLLGKGDKAYVRGDLKKGTSFQIFRRGKPLLDPGTRTVIGYEAAYLGTVKLDRAATADDEAHRFIVVGAKEEMGVGDLLRPMPPAPLLNYVPHPPENRIDARIVSVYGGVKQAGQNNIVTINKGVKDGIDTGTVLELYRYGGVIADRTDDRKPVRLPDEKYGTLFIFRPFSNISYALVMQVRDTVQVGDTAKSPE